MEDAYVAIDAMPLPSDWVDCWERASFYAVYDGHGGAEASDFCRQHVHKHLLRHLAEARASAAAGQSAGPATGPASVVELAVALRAAFNSVDEAFLNGTTHNSGSTAVAALVTETHVLVANTGDSRGYLQRGGQVLRMSLDHKPDRVDEEARITRAGGWVSHGRVLHTLAVSRAIGDRDFKLLSYADGRCAPPLPGRVPHIFRARARRTTC